ncbi:MAG: MFS transporter [Desulfohalobium sp.]
MRALLANQNLQILFAVTLMVVMGVSSIIPVLPTLIKVFGVTPENIGLVLTSFTLPGVLFTPIFGILADRLGRKKILVPALVLFGVAGFACTLARNWELLLLLRFLQGTGAAAFGMINITIIGDIFSGTERTAALGLNASVLSIATAVYPAIGGGLAILGWHYPFALPLVAVVLAGIVLWFLDTTEP